MSSILRKCLVYRASFSISGIHSSTKEAPTMDPMRQAAAALREADSSR
jgi:hypothetical protein